MEVDGPVTSGMLDLTQGSDPKGMPVVHIIK